MDKLELEEFNPNIAKLTEIVADSKKIVVTDLTSEKQMSVVKEKRIELKGMRVVITKQGKEYRQKAIEFQKIVIGKEKELIGIIEPEEIRLKEIEDKSEQLKKRKMREEGLPLRKEKLLEASGGMKLPQDEELLDMDIATFHEYLNKVGAEKNEKDRLAIEENNRLLAEKNEKLEREKEIRDAEETARKEERETATKDRERLEKEATERIEKAESDSKERIAREEREIEERKEKEKQQKLEEERIEKERQEKLEKEKKYQKFLKDNGYNESNKNDFVISNSPTETKLFKLIGTFKHNN